MCSATQGCYADGPRVGSVALFDRACSRALMHSVTSGPRIAGPGGAEVFRDSGGALWAAFHAFSEPNVGYPSSRYIHVARVRVIDGGIVIDATT